MLTTNDKRLFGQLDIDIRDILNNDQNIQKILKYEIKYDMNSFDILNVSTTSEDILKWQDMVIEFIHNNGNIKQINKIHEINYIAFPTLNKEMSNKIFVKYIRNYKTNDILVVSSLNPLYEKVILRCNSLKRFVLLLTNDIDLLKKDDTTNVVKVYSDNPENDILKISNIKIKYVKTAK